MKPFNAADIHVQKIEKHLRKPTFFEDMKMSFYVFGVIKIFIEEL